MYPVGSAAGRLASHNPDGLRIAVPPGQSVGVNGVPSNFTFPNTLKQRRPPVYGEPSGLVRGPTGLPAKSTDAMIGSAGLGLVTVSALPGFQPSKYRKMPCRAVLVITLADTRLRSDLSCWSHSA